MSEDIVVVNGESLVLASERGRRLLDWLRVTCGLTGTKEGCGEGECGACTVLIDGDPYCSCLVLTDTVAGKSVTTIEGIDPTLKARFAAAADALGGVQCGFCTPGFVVMAAWISSKPEFEASGIRKLLEGNLCRCTGYVQLIHAIERVVEERHALGSPEGSVEGPVT